MNICEFTLAIPKFTPIHNHNISAYSELDMRTVVLVIRTIVTFAKREGGCASKQSPNIIWSDDQHYGHLSSVGAVQVVTGRFA